MGKVKKEMKEEKKSSAMTDKEIVEAHSTYATLKQKIADAGSPVQSFFKKLEDRGEHKAAFKFASKLSDMEPLKAQDTWRQTVRYLTALGFFDQGDMIDALPGAEISAPPSPTAPQSAAAH